jgi:hypothetical protein
MVRCELTGSFFFRTICSGRFLIRLLRILLWNTFRCHSTNQYKSAYPCQTPRSERRYSRNNEDIPLN